MIRKLKLPPTKTTLIRLKRQVAFLHQGQDLLERKGELLGRLIHQHLQEYRQLREVMHEKVHDAYHWLGIMRGILLKASDLSVLWPNVLILVVMGTIIATFSMRYVRRALN